MSVEIKCDNISVGGSSVMLVSVRGGEAGLGVCSTGLNPSSGDASTVNKFFYIGSDPVVNINCPNLGSQVTDKMLSFSSGFQGVDHEIFDAFTADLNKLNRGESLSAGLKEIFSLLTDGVYTVYTSEYYPTDGNGIFFWGAYNINHEVRGTAEHSVAIGNKPYRPCFLVPSQPMDTYAPKTKQATDEAAKSRRVQGIVYHLSGFHSVLLKGHHGAVSCAENGIPFKCAVIERVCQPYTDPFVAPIKKAAPPPAEEAPAEGGEAAAPVPVTPPASAAEEREGISGFRSASVKIPLEAFPKDVLRLILETHPDVKPPHFKSMMNKTKAVRKRAFSNNIFPREALDKCELMPDSEMVESAFAIDDISDAQLNALLAGDTELNGRIIISPNFYSSIVTACNFLQFKDEPRFISFSISILENPDLNATHEYTARRLARLVANDKAYRFFKDVLASGDAKYEKFMSVAERYVKEYDLNKK